MSGNVPTIYPWPENSDARRLPNRLDFSHLRSFEHLSDAATGYWVKATYTHIEGTKPPISPEDQDQIYARLQNLHWIRNLRVSDHSVRFEYPQRYSFSTELNTLTAFVIHMLGKSALLPGQSYST